MTQRSMSLLLSASLLTALLTGCCCGSFAEEFQEGFAEGLEEGLQEASETTTTELDAGASWGKIKAKRSTKVFETPSVTAPVIGRLAEREESEYYGFDPSGEFYKVIADGGVQGYVPVKDANVKLR